MVRESEEVPLLNWYLFSLSEGSIDLHLHTNHSDGKFSPEQLVATAAVKQLQAIAVTDHVTVGVVRESEHWAREDGLEFLSGVEICACTAEAGEIHILGYRIESDSPVLQEALARQKGVHLKRIRRMLDRLHGCGIRIASEKVQEIAGNASSIGRNRSNLLGLSRLRIVYVNILKTRDELVPCQGEVDG